MKLSSFFGATRARLFQTAGALATALLFVLIFTDLNIVFSSQTGLSRFQRIDFIPGTESIPAGSGFGRFFLTFTGQVSAKICREPSLPLFYLDLLGAGIETSPFIITFPYGPAKLVRLSQIEGGSPALRATFFLRRKLEPSIRQLPNGIEVGFSDPGVEKERSKNPYSLIAPGESAPPPFLPTPRTAEPAMIRIKVENADAATLLRELARQLQKSVYFRDPIQANVDLDISARDPAEAMRQVAQQIGFSLTEEDGEIWISRAENPILRISDSDQVEGADLSKMALGDLLRGLGQIAEVNVALDRSVASLRDLKSEVFLQKVSVRRAFETLLKINDLVLKSVDDKTLLVMTASNSRSLEGKVVRVCPLQTPFEKVKTLVGQSVAPEIAGRVTLQEDLGNLLLTGDKDAVEIVQAALTAVESKLLKAGEGLAREYFQPINTKPDELIKLVGEVIEKSENVKISQDKRTDMVLVSGPPSSVQRALAVIKRLDLHPTKQALIHIRLIEVHLSDLEEMGIRLPTQLAAFPDLAKASISSVVIPADFQGFQENTKVKTLANPTVRCMDKEQATINISEQIPVKNTVTEYLPIASSTLAARTTDNWTTSEVGVNLSVKPTIHPDNEISMDVNVDLTELVSLVEGHPWTAKRTVKTQVRVKDRETVVIGGLIRNKRDLTKRPVTILNKIPLLRSLLRLIEYRNRKEEKAEMVILITPRVVTSGGEPLERTEAIQSKARKPVMAHAKTRGN